MSLEYETRQQNSALATLKQRAAPPTLTDQKPNVLYTMPVQTVERLEEVLQQTLALQKTIQASMAALATKESLEPLAIIETYTIPRIGDIKLKKLTTRHLQKLYKELLEDGRIHVGKEQAQGLSTTTVRSVHLMLHAALERAVKERLIPRNPSEDCIAPKPRKIEMQILPSEDMHA